MVDEELIEVRDGADPAEAEHSRRGPRSDPLDEPLKLTALHQPYPTSLGEPLAPAGQDQARASKEIVLALHEVGGEIFGSPAWEKRGSVGPEPFEQIAQREALLRIQRELVHLFIIRAETRSR